MPAGVEDIAATEMVERATPDTTSITTTLYDLITALNEAVEPWEEDLVTDTVVHLCQTGKLHFLRVAGVVKAQMPGVSQDNLQVSITDDTLTLKGEIKEEEKKGEKNYYGEGHSRAVSVRRLRP